MDIAAIGTPEFLLGFEIAGLRETLRATPETVIATIAQCSDAKVLIVDGKLTEQLPLVVRQQIETSIDPVIITLAKDGAKEIDRLRKEMRLTLGVDLLT